MIEGIQLENGKYGRRAVITSAWSTEMSDYLASIRIDEIELNDGKGCHGSDISFLCKFKDLISLKIIDLRISSVSSIHDLRKLRNLELLTYCKTEVNFSAFPQIEDCAIEWNSKIIALSECVSLKNFLLIVIMAQT